MKQIDLVCVDGNDGTGKTTLVERLRGLGYNVQDRGLPTTLTDYPDQRSQKFDYGITFIILDAPVEISQERLRMAGKDLHEQYHTLEDLTHYKQRFLEVADYLQRHGHETNTKCFVVDATPDLETILNNVLEILNRSVTNQ